MGEELACGRRGAEVREANEGIARAQPFAPALLDGSFDCDARRIAEDRLLIGRPLLAEELEGGQ